MKWLIPALVFHLLHKCRLFDFLGLFGFVWVGVRVLVGLFVVVGWVLAGFLCGCVGGGCGGVVGVWVWGVVVGGSLVFFFFFVFLVVFVFGWGAPLSL